MHFQQIQHEHFVRMMPPLILAAILAGLVWLLWIRARFRTAEFWLVASATAAVLFCFVLTRAVNLPINEQLMTWSVESPPVNVRELWAPWERAHTVRTIVSSGAFLLEVVALSLSAGGSSPAKAPVR